MLHLLLPLFFSSICYDLAWDDYFGKGFLYDIYELDALKGLVCDVAGFFFILFIIYLRSSYMIKFLLIFIFSFCSLTCHLLC